MAVEDPSAIPALFSGIDDLLTEEAELDLERDYDTGDPTSYGRSLSFDWANLRFRLNSIGQPMYVSGQAALLEDIVKMLLTPRFVVPIYTDDYGSEFEDLLGLPAGIVLVQVEAMVRDALLIDDRISIVEDVVVAERPGGAVSVRISVRDFNGLLLDVPEVLIRG